MAALPDVGAAMDGPLAYRLRFVPPSGAAAAAADHAGDVVADR